MKEAIKDEIKKYYKAYIAVTEKMTSVKNLRDNCAKQHGVKYCYECPERHDCEEYRLYRNLMFEADGKAEGIRERLMYIEDAEIRNIAGNIDLISEKDIAVVPTQKVKDIYNSTYNLRARDAIRQIFTDIDFENKDLLSKI